MSSSSDSELLYRQVITHASSTSKIFPVPSFKNLVNQLEDVVLDEEAGNLATGTLADADLEVLDKVYQVLVLVDLELLYASAPS
jgi:hypothetical protein